MAESNDYIFDLGIAMWIQIYSISYLAFKRLASFYIVEMIVGGKEAVLFQITVFVFDVERELDVEWNAVGCKSEIGSVAFQFLFWYFVVEQFVDQVRMDGFVDWLKLVELERKSGLCFRAGVWSCVNVFAENLNVTKN